jgi:hypothetical protein
MVTCVVDARVQLSEEQENAALLKDLSQHEVTEFFKKLILRLRKTVLLVLGATLFTVSLLLARNVQLEGLFFGLQAAVVAVVIEAVLRIGKRVLKNGAMVAIAAVAFIAIFFLNVPFPLIVLAAGVVGYVGGKIWQERFYDLPELVCNQLLLTHALYLPTYAGFERIS